MAHLPHVPDISSYSRLFRQNDVWWPAIAEIAQSHGLPTEHLQRCPTGSAIVYRCAGRILKLFAPFWPEESERERLGLSRCAALDIPVPMLYGEGQYQGWDYLILEELPGISLGEVWADLAVPQQQALLTQAADIMQALHGLTVPHDSALEPVWPDFVQQQMQHFAVQQQEKGLSDAWIRPLVQELETHAPSLLETSPVLLHSDLTDDHFLVQAQDGHWQITGLIDFGDLMQGHFLYEFGAPLVFYTRGKPALRRHFVQQYGLPLNTQTEDQLFAALLLHRFVNIPWYLQHLCPPDIQDVKALKSFFCGLT